MNTSAWLGWGSTDRSHFPGWGSRGSKEVRPDHFCPSQGCQHTWVRAGGPQATRYGDRPAGRLEEGTSGTPSLTLHIPRAGVNGRVEPGLPKELPGQPTAPSWQEEVLTGTPVSQRPVCDTNAL